MSGWRDWLGIGYQAPVPPEAGAEGPQTIDILRAIDALFTRVDELEARVVTRTQTETGAVLSTLEALFSVLGARVDATQATVHLADERASGWADRVALRLEELAAQLRDAEAHVVDRLHLMRPPATRGATAHSDAAVPAGQPIEADCGHLTTSFVTRQTDGRTVCAQCHRRAVATQEAP